MNIPGPQAKPAKSDSLEVLQLLWMTMRLGYFRGINRFDGFPPCLLLSLKKKKKGI